MEYLKIDINGALEQLGHSDKLYKTVVKGFYEKYEHVDQDIKDLMEEGALEEAQRMAHSIKGLSGNLGATGLREKALALELTFKDHEGLLASKEALVDFSKELEGVMVEVRALLTERFHVLAPVEGESLHHGSQVLLKALDHLRLALQTYKYKDVQSAMSQLKQTSIPASYKAQVESITRYIETYEYDLAIDVIRKIMTT